MGHVSHMGDVRNAYKILVRKSYVRRTLIRCKRGLENNISTDHRYIGGKVWTGFI
jgi:hypothetical protein